MGRATRVATRRTVLCIATTSGVLSVPRDCVPASGVAPLRVMLLCCALSPWRPGWCRAPPCRRVGLSVRSALVGEHGHGGFGQVAAVADLLFVVCFEQHTGRKPLQCSGSGEDPDDVGALLCDLSLDLSCLAC